MIEVIDPSYEALVLGQAREASILVAVLDPESDPPTAQELAQRLCQGPVSVEGLTLESAPSSPNARFELTGEAVGAEQRTIEFRVTLETSSGLEDLHLQGHGITDSDIERSERARWKVGIELELGQKALWDFHLQLRLLQVLCPDPALVIDVTSCRPLSREWLREIAASHVPPAPELLFSIHAVHDQEAGRNCWFHTHGLTRCGSIELEILHTRFEHYETLGRLMHAAAAMFVDRGVPEAETVFSAGSGIDLMWLPWQSGLSRFPLGILGGRQDRDEHHDGPSGILFAKTGLVFKRTRNPSVYLPNLTENSVLYASNMEKERMNLLARERQAGLVECSVHPDSTGTDPHRA